MTVQENLSSEQGVALSTLDFLKLVHPGGPWTLTTILKQDEKNTIIRAKTFDDRQLGEMGSWVRENNSKVNLYWQINPLRVYPSSKAMLQDVSAVTRFHVDLDPRKNTHDREGEREIIRALLTDEDWLKRVGLPGGPSLTLDSGNGYWAFWDLARPIPIIGEEEGARRELAAEIGRHNRWIAEVLNEALNAISKGVAAEIADTCHNIDRISRLPGTVNIPDPNKLAAGYKEELATVFTHNPERIYTADQFEKSKVISWGAGATASDLKRVEIGEIVRILPDSNDPYEIGQELQRLFPQIGDKTVQLICLGEYVDGDEEDSNLRDKLAKDGNLAVNRSRAHWRANRHMQHVGVPLNVILGVLSDERLPISAHAIEPIDEKTGRRGSRRSGRDLLRFNEIQIRKCAISLKRQQEAEAKAAEVLAGQRPAEAASSPEGAQKADGLKDDGPKKKQPKTKDDVVKFLNERHAVLEHEGGKCCILSWETSEFGGREIPILQTVPDFKNRYAHQLITVGQGKEAKLKSWAEVWFTSPNRRQYLALRFLPGQPREVEGYLNLWRGWAVEPKQGDWSLMQRHIRDVLAGGNEEYADYILNWAAWAVQNPHRPAEAALVFRGEKGVGKGIFGRAMQNLFGSHGLQITHQNNITGRFNGHLRACCLLFADEAISAGDKQAESVLKGLITEPQLQIERKRIDMTAARNHLHIIMASNEEWVVPASGAERRFAVFDVLSTFRQEKAYFDALYNEIENDKDTSGLAAMLYDLLNRDIGQWHPRGNIPQTEALRKQKEISLAGFDQFMFAMLEDGALLGRTGSDPNTSYSLTTDRELGLYDCIRESSPKLRATSYQVIATYLKKWGCEHYVSRGRNGNRQRGWLFPPLKAMREQWNKDHWTHIWPNPEQVNWSGNEGIMDDDEEMPF